jgi:hypothetical protein
MFVSGGCLGAFIDDIYKCNFIGSLGSFVDDKYVSLMGVLMPFGGQK